MSRAVRTARGAFGALSATLFAAASHACAGGAVTPIAVITTVLFALPLCVLLAGRTGSLWRLSIAVVAAQFVYHWSFSGLGLAATTGAPESPVSPHAAHLGLLSPALFMPETAAAVSPGLSMWAAHLVAAMLTIALMHRGERAALHLARVLRSAAPVRVPLAVRLPARPAILEFFATLPARTQRDFLSAISYRGPPLSLAPSH